jgi:hypothetical protein
LNLILALEIIDIGIMKITVGRNMTEIEIQTLLQEARLLRGQIDDLMLSDLALACIGEPRFSQIIQNAYHRLNEINELIAG